MAQLFGVAAVASVLVLARLDRVAMMLLAYRRLELAASRQLGKVNCSVVKYQELLRGLILAYRSALVLKSDSEDWSSLAVAAGLAEIL